MLQYRDPWLIEQYGKKKEVSLGTKDLAEAKLLAIPYQKLHRERLLTAKKRRLASPKMVNLGWVYPLGESQLPDGTKIMATESSAWIMSPSGSMKVVKNGIMLGQTRDPDEDVGPPLPPTNNSDPALEHFERALKTEAPKTDPDRKFFDDWVSETKPNQYKVNEADKVWAIFKAVSGGKRMQDCHRPDGRAVMVYLQAEGYRNATCNKFLSHLSGMANIAIANGHLRFNPFSKCLLDPEADEVRRDPYTEAEMKIVRDALPGLQDDERLLWVMLATTGMRLGEAFQIKTEMEADGIRYATFGTKTRSSFRRVPFPDALLPFLPSKIEGPLFGDTKPKALGQRLRRKLHKLGLNRENTCPHSLRHRAKDRMRDYKGDFEIETKINDAVTGHGEVTEGDGYGKGQPIWKLKRAVNVIGY